MESRSQQLRMCLALLLLAGNGQLCAQTLVGQVKDIDKEGYILRLSSADGSFDNPDDVFKKAEIGDNIYLGNIVGAKRKNGVVYFVLAGKPSTTVYEVHWGEVKVALQTELDLTVCPEEAQDKFDDAKEDFKDAAEKYTLEVERGSVQFDGEHHDILVKTDAANICPLGTSFEVRSVNAETQVLVYEGEVHVSSLDAQYEHWVPAGHWITASVGSPIIAPRPFRVMTKGPGSGSTECIQSDCTKIHKVPIPDIPDYRRRIFAPGPNPPGFNPPGGPPGGR